MLSPGQYKQIADVVVNMTLVQICNLTEFISAGASWGEILKHLG